jgi:mannose-1-phosphate guanylyltransferase
MGARSSHKECIMKALILAAGRGTRVRPLTDTLPKPLIPIVNKPVMEFLVDHLRHYGFDQIMVNTSYMSSRIENHFRDGSLYGVEMAYSFEGREQDGRLVDEPLGSAGAIRKIHRHSGFFDQTFVVLCGDAVIDIDFDALLQFHRESKAMATIALREVPRDQVQSYGVVVSDKQGRILEFQEKPKPEEAKSCMVNTGIYIFEPEILDLIPEEGPYDIGGQLFPKMAELGAPLYGINLETPWQWLDIGQIPDFHEVNMKALKGEIRGFRMPGRQVREGVWVGLNVKGNLDNCKIEGPVYIGGSAEIQDGSVLIGPVVIGSGSVIETGAHVENSVVMDHTRVLSGTFLSGKILGSRYCVDSDGTVLDESHTDSSWLFADARRQSGQLTPDQRRIHRMMDLMAELEV